MLTREPELRFHHLLCLPLFQGKGYSDGFSVNMQSVKDRLESEDTAVRFVCSGDMICQHCPNRTEDGCLLDGCGGTVAQKDSEVCRLSEIECHSVENYRSALTRLRSKMDKKALIYYARNVAGQSLVCAALKSGVRALMDCFLRDRSRLSFFYTKVQLLRRNSGAVHFFAYSSLA